MAIVLVSHPAAAKAGSAGVVGVLPNIVTEVFPLFTGAWLLATTATPREIADALVGVIPATDDLLVSTVSARDIAGSLHPAAWEWMRTRS